MIKAFIKKDNLTELVDIIINNPQITPSQVPQNAKPQPQQVTANDGDIITLEIILNGEEGKLTIDRKGNATWDPYITIEIDDEE